MSRRDLKKKIQAAVLRSVDPMEELPFLADLPIGEAERVIEEFVQEVQEECYKILASLDPGLFSMLTPPVLYATYRQHGVSLSRDTLFRLCEEILHDDLEIVCDVDLETAGMTDGLATIDDRPAVPGGDDEEQKVYLVTMTL